MSIGSVIVIPTPTAGPLMAAITGFSDAKIRSDTSPPLSRGTASVGLRVAPVEGLAAAAEVGAGAERRAPRR